MEVYKIIESLEMGGNLRKTSEMLETLMMKILHEHLERQNKELIVNYSLKQNYYYGEFDGFAPEGFDKFEGPTVIELKFYRSEDVLTMLRHGFKKLLERIKNSNLKVNNIIYIIARKLEKRDKIKTQEQLMLMYGENINIEVWDNEDLEELFRLYPESVTKALDNISELMINTKIITSFQRDINDWKTKQKTDIEKLKQIFASDDLVLFLGAGISVDAKISSWDDLVRGLLVNLIGNKFLDHKINLSEQEREFIVGKLKGSNGSSPLLIARYIRKGLENIFSTTLTETLYKNCVDTSDTLDKIAQLCLPERGKTGIRGVVTYNFDDLLEYNLKEYKIKFKSIYREADFPMPNELGIYHVHGFLPRASDEYKELSKSLLVFSEEGYHDLMLDPYNWANLIQLNYLRENTCLFIGLSMTDPNLRRLLDIAVRKQEENVCRHYVLLKRESYSTNTHKKEKIDVSNIEKFDIVNQELLENYYKELGLNIIWFESYTDIPEIIHQIKE